jgi:hypothetical protein
MRKLVILCLAVGLAGASNFYIFYKQVGANPNCPALSIDARNNAPSHREWAMDSAGGFSEDTTLGDWLIRAVLDWTPQDTNASTVWFTTNFPKDTASDINFSIRAMIKNMGKDTLPNGTPVRLSITGPNSYAYNDTMTTTTKLKHGATAQMVFAPTWHIPNVAGVYNVNVWTEAAGEMWPADDTISYDLNCLHWIQYHVDANLHWLTWAAPERAVKFNPADFGLQYPFGISRVKAAFYLYDTIPWPDTSFTFKIYGDDGQTLLYQSETLEAIPGKPGAYRSCDLDSTLVISSGTFYVAVAPVSSTGHPSSCADSSLVGDHSYWNSPGAWILWTPGTGLHGDFFISAAVQDSVGLASSERWIGPSENPRDATPDPSAAVHGSSSTASTEQWIEPSEKQHYAIPDPQPEVFPFSPTLLPGQADTLKYDDGNPAGARCQNVAGGGWGVKFISPADSVTIAGALVHFNGIWPRPGDTMASFRVYADDGTNGAPGTELYAIDSFIITRGVWNFIPLAPVAVKEGFEPGLNSPSLRITNCPNPGTDQVTLKWQVPSSMPVSVNLYDATGRMMRNLYTAKDRARAGTLTLDAKSLAAGIYLVRLETAKGSATRKLVIDR